MPTNLPPQYFEAEKKLKVAKTPQEKMSVLEELLSIVPKHKGTEKLQALLKTKIAKLKFQVQKKPIIGRQRPAFNIEKAGAGQVILIGPPNTGKSMLIKALTNATPEIGNYPFTTRIPSPAMMEYENIQIQLVDAPPITPDYMESWHSELIKGADGISIILDLTSPNPAGALQALLEKLKEKKIEIIAENKEIPSDKQQFIKKALIVANKIDQPLAKENLISLKKYVEPEYDLISVSASRGDNLEDFKKRIFIFLNVLRVYSKTPGKKVEFNAPFIFKKGSSLMDMAKAVHKDFSQKLKYARIWGKNKYQGQKVNMDYILQDEDIIELHI